MAELVTLYFNLKAIKRVEVFIHLAFLLNCAILAVWIADVNGYPLIVVPVSLETVIDLFAKYHLALGV